MMADLLTPKQIDDIVKAFTNEEEEDGEKVIPTKWNIIKRWTRTILKQRRLFHWVIRYNIMEYENKGLSDVDIMFLSVLFEPRALWFGVHWNYCFGNFDIQLCLIPCFPVQFVKVIE